MATADATLAALFSDPDPVARLIAADLLEEQGRDLESVWQRILVLVPVRAASEELVNDPLWCIRLMNTGTQTSLHCYDYRSKVAYLWVGDHWQTGHWGGWNFCFPPPAIEIAVLAALRRRLEELQP